MLTRTDRAALTVHLAPTGGTTDHPALAVTQSATGGAGGGVHVTSENTAAPALDVSGGTGVVVRSARTDRAPRLTVSGAGALTWGDGSGAGDVTLSRTASGVLTVTGHLTGTDQVATKAAAQTVTNSAVLVDDADLVVPVVAGAVYAVELVLLYSAAAAADLQVAVTGPAAATLPLVLTGLPSTAAAAGDAHAVQVGALGDAAALTIGAVAAGTEVAAVARGILTTAAAGGDLQVRWAQAAADASDAVVDSGSWLRATRIS